MFISDAEIKAAVRVAEFCAQQHARPRPNMDADELKSAGLVGIAQAALKFDSGRGVKFAAFARPCISARIKDHLRKQSHGLRGTLIEFSPSESMSAIPVQGTSGAEPTFATIRAREILRKLDPDRRAILIDHYILGFSAEEIALRSQINERTIDARISRAVKAARAL